jgi:hypothetical protein
LRYVAGTLDHGLCYTRMTGKARFVGYSDSDLAGDIFFFLEYAGGLRIFILRRKKGGTPKQKQQFYKLTPPLTPKTAPLNGRKREF